MFPFVTGTFFFRDLRGRLVEDAFNCCSLSSTVVAAGEDVFSLTMEFSSIESLEWYDIFVSGCGFEVADNFSET
jgi:hypothetical protein